MFLREANSFFTEASAFFKHDVSSFIKQIASSINTRADNPNSSDSIAKSSKKSNYLSKQELKTLLSPHSLLNLEDNILTVTNVDKSDKTKSDVVTSSRTGNFTVATTLDMRLQNFLLEQIDSLMMLDKGKPEIIAMVAMEPHTGKILAMAGFDSQSPNTNPCTDKEYPAASLFKLVTASAAVEACGYSPATTMYFSGGKYTLYKRQISEEGNSKYLNKVTLAEAFAQSINPVFGKLGSIMLGRDILEKYASSFGFNQEIDSEINLRSGNFTITDNNSYQWAEVASGFNRTTTISPMFGAMLASTMLNGGKTPVPCIVESVKDDNGKVLYKRKDETLNSNTVKPDTARAMMQMMNGTVITGTARKSFRGVDKDHVLAGLKMGGKTGSLSNSDRSIKFDWFTGFCSDSQEKEQIVVSVLVGHGKYIGTKASIYGRLMFKEYFNNYFALNPKQSSNG
ncbi:MAG: PbpA [Desulfamplus sp.]|nr:PbpA [Desulfamplus sp.]